MRILSGLDVHERRFEDGQPIDYGATSTQDPGFDSTGDDSFDGFGDDSGDDPVFEPVDEESEE